LKQNLKILNYPDADILVKFRQLHSQLVFFWFFIYLIPGVANLLPAGIFLPLRPFLNALQIFLELLNNFLNRKLNPNYVWSLISWWIS
jgi:hypothetical protein